MKSRISRRDFVRTTAVAGVASGLINESSLSAFAAQGSTRPVVVSSANGLRATARAMEMIRAGAWLQADRLAHRRIARRLAEVEREHERQGRLGAGTGDARRPAAELDLQRRLG